MQGTYQKKNCQVLYWKNIECFLEVGAFTVYVSDAFLRLSNDLLLEVLTHNGH